MSQLQSAYLDPAICVMFDRMQKEINSLKDQLKVAQDELSAWTFTADRCEIKKSSEIYLLLLP